jgi:hypothetical protein
MQARIGDQIVVHGHRSGDPNRDCEVLEVRGVAGAPPYLVRWGDDGHESLFFPGPDASLGARAHHRRSTRGPAG